MSLGMTIKRHDYKIWQNHFCPLSGFELRIMHKKAQSLH